MNRSKDTPVEWACGLAGSTQWPFSLEYSVLFYQPRFCDSHEHILPGINSSSSSNDRRFTRLILTLAPRLDNTNHWTGGGREIGNPEFEVLSADSSNLPPKTPMRETWFMAKHSPSHVGAPNVEDNSSSGPARATSSFGWAPPLQCLLHCPVFVPTPTWESFSCGKPMW